MGNLNEHFRQFRLMCFEEALNTYGADNIYGSPGDLFVESIHCGQVFRIHADERARLAAAIQPLVADADTINSLFQVAADEDKSEETFPLFDPPPAYTFTEEQVAALQSLPQPPLDDDCERDETYPNYTIPRSDWRWPNERDV